MIKKKNNVHVQFYAATAVGTTGKEIEIEKD
jgi:hypothetical protein